jgi:predicted aldo/keto reductase-like oxidoreductase
MKTLDRREFLRTTIAAATVTTAWPALAAPAAPALKATTKRTLGKTKLTCSLLGVGTGTRGDEQSRMPDDGLVAMLEHAYARGITYFDLADRYKSHPYMNKALKNSIPREKVMILSKSWSREADDVAADLERFRQELDTDYLDIVLLHCIRGGEDDWPNKLKPAMDVMAEAKAKGHIRAHGVSIHNFEALKRIADTEWCDVALIRINPYNIRMDAPAEEVVPVIESIHKAGKGVLGMKILGEGDPQVIAKMSQALEFAMGLGTIDAMTIGFLSTDELDDVITRMDAAGAKLASMNVRGGSSWLERVSSSA